MAKKILSDRLFYRLCCCVLYFVAASASFNGYYDKWHLGEDGVSGEDDRFQFEMMIDGTAYRPYVFRQMLPAVSNSIYRPFRTRSKRGYITTRPVRKRASSPSSSLPPPEIPSISSAIRSSTANLSSPCLPSPPCTWFCRASIPAPPAAASPRHRHLLVPADIESGGGYFYDLS